MWRKVFKRPGGALHPRRFIATHHATGGKSSPSTVDSAILRFLKEHYTEVAKMNPPPKISPPSPFSIVKGSLDNKGPVLRRTYGDEEIGVSVMHLSDIIPGVRDGDGVGDSRQLFVCVGISKPGREDSLNFLCAIYPEAMEVHSVAMRPKFQSSPFFSESSRYNGPSYGDMSERTRDALHRYIEERGVNESLFRFLEAWLYVKDIQKLQHWFKTVGTCIKSASPLKLEDVA